MYKNENRDEILKRQHFRIRNSNENPYKNKENEIE